jgi:hypothetical protein
LLRDIQLIHFYIIHTVRILTINVHISLPGMIYITLYLDEIPSGHIIIEVGVCTYVPHRTKTITDVCLELLMYSFNNALL